MNEFTGFGPHLRIWFEGLEADNRRDDFAANRDLFGDLERTDSQRANHERPRAGLDVRVPLIRWIDHRMDLLGGL